MIDHGSCPIPAPGTAEILKGIPLADIPIESELTTTTGAAIAKTLADSLGPMPTMTIEAIGCGCGTKPLPERANVLRIFIGTVTVSAGTEHVVMLETNLENLIVELRKPKIDPSRFTRKEWNALPKRILYRMIRYRVAGCEAPITIVR